MMNTPDSHLVKNGKWKEFNKHAILIAEGFYLDGRKHGVWREYYDHSGDLMIEEEYDHGVAHGFYRSFHPNGQVLSEGHFENGLRQGSFTIYDEDGKRVNSLYFINDKLIEDNNSHLFYEVQGKERN